MMSLHVLQCPHGMAYPTYCRHVCVFTVPAGCVPPLIVFNGCRLVVIIRGYDISSGW